MKSEVSKYCRAFSFVTKNKTNDMTNWILINCVVWLGRLCITDSHFTWTMIISNIYGIWKFKTIYSKTMAIWVETIQIFNSLYSIEQQLCRATKEENKFKSRPVSVRNMFNVHGNDKIGVESQTNKFMV